MFAQRGYLTTLFVKLHDVCNGMGGLEHLLWGVLEGACCHHPGATAHALVPSLSMAAQQVPRQRSDDHHTSVVPDSSMLGAKMQGEGAAALKTEWGGWQVDLVTAQTGQQAGNNHCLNCSRATAPCTLLQVPSLAAGGQARPDVCRRACRHVRPRHATRFATEQSKALQGCATSPLQIFAADGGGGLTLAP